LVACLWPPQLPEVGISNACGRERWGEIYGPEKRLHLSASLTITARESIQERPIFMSAAIC